jgi:membrane-bound lytic murein transglycosylase D
MRKILPKDLIFWMVLLVLSVYPGICIQTRAETNLFPKYPSIQPNVSFWQKIYSHYSTHQGVIHDKQNLDIIYGVIALEDIDLPGSRKINRERIKKAKKHFKNILKNLVRAASASGSEEQRVADLFGPHAQRADFKKAIKNIRCQVGQKDRFRRGLIRSGAYLEEIKWIFRNYGLPEDLAYLPHVESSFNPKAYSKFGAAGIWQFTRSTGKRYMRISYTVDERRDPILSSHAAAKLLKKNYEKFLNWPMTITAYNYGTNGMLRAQRAKGNYEAIFNDYKKGLFKFASRNFYSEFLAAREVAKNYQQYFGELQLDVPTESTAVRLAGFASLPELARQLKVDPEILRRLNPALRDPVFSGQKLVPRGYPLRLPSHQDRNWESLIAELSPAIFKHDQKHSRFYTVREGDTASQIAHRHRIKLQDLITANNLDTEATIYVNQHLRIPLPGETTPTLVSLNRPGGKAQQKSGSQKIRSGTINPSAEAAKVLKESDFLPDGKKQMIISPELRRLKDKLKSSRLLARREPLPNQKSKVLEPSITAAPSQMQATDKQPLQEPSPAADGLISGDQPHKTAIYPLVFIENVAIERIQHQNGTLTGIIRVEVEETLGHYAEWSKVTAAEIRRLNGIRYGQMIRIDQPLKIPLHRVTSQEFEELRFEYHKELSEDFFATYRVDSVQTYTIKKGDNIWTLSREEFEVPLWLIRRYNADVDFYKLMPSQKLLIPVVEKRFQIPT